MRQRSLNQSCWKRATEDTISAQKTARFMWVGEGVLAVAGGIWYAQLGPINGPVLEMIWRSVVGGLGGLATAVLIIFVCNISRAPYKQRNEARKEVAELRVGLGQVGWLEGLRHDGIDYLKALERSEFKILDDFSRERFNRWYKDVAEYLQGNIPHEFTEWRRKVDIDIDKASFDNVIEAYGVGLDILKDATEKIISSIPHTEGSQN